VHETAEDLAAPRALIGAGYAAAGPHLLAIHDAERMFTPMPAS
jgi:hypothetical protein